VKKSVQNYFDLIFGKLYEIIFYLLAIKFDVQFFGRLFWMTVIGIATDGFIGYKFF
jgi:hypothetical protein